MQRNPYEEAPRLTTRPTHIRYAAIALTLVAALAAIACTLHDTAPATHSLAELTSEHGTHLALAEGDVTLTECIRLPDDVGVEACDVRVELTCERPEGGDSLPLADVQTRAVPHGHLIEVPITLDATGLQGSTVRAQARVTQGETCLIDITGQTGTATTVDPAQEVLFPALAVTCDTDELSCDDQAIRAHATCENLLSSTVGTLEVTLVDARTGKPIEGDAAHALTRLAAGKDTGISVAQEVTLTHDSATCTADHMRIEARLIMAGSTIARCQGMDAPIVAVPHLTEQSIACATSATGTISCRRTLRYSGLVPGRAYRLTSRLRNTDEDESEEPRASAVTTDADKDEDAAQVLELVPEASAGTVELSFALTGTSAITGDTSANSMALPVFEDTLIRTEGDHVLATLTTDEGRTLPFATLAACGAHTGLPAEPATTDAALSLTLETYGLEPGATYTATPMLTLLSDEGEALGQVPRAAGTVAGESVSFTVPDNVDDTDDASKSTVELTCPFDATRVAGSSVRPSISVSRDTTLVAEAEASEVAIPTLSVVASDATTGLHEARATDDLEIAATVTMAGMPTLAPDHAPTLTVTILDALTGTTLTAPDGERAVASVNLADMVRDATPMLHIPVDAADGLCCELVAIATLEATDTGGVNHVLATTADTWTQASRVHLPALTCTLTDAATLTHAAGSSVATDLVATVAIGGTEQDVDHTAELTLIDTETGTTVLDTWGRPACAVLALTGASEPLTASTTLTADTATLAGHTIALRCRILTRGSVSAEGDIEDEDCRVHVPRLTVSPEVTTTATGEDAIDVTWENLPALPEDVAFTVRGTAGLAAGTAPIVACADTGTVSVPLTSTLVGIAGDDEQCSAPPAASLDFDGHTLAVADSSEGETTAAPTSSADTGSTRTSTTTATTTDGQTPSVNRPTTDARATATPVTGDASASAGERLLARIICIMGCALLASGIFALTGMATDQDNER